MKAVWIVGCLPAGGVGPVVQLLLNELARTTDWDLHLVVLSDCREPILAVAPVQVSVLGLAREPKATCVGFHAWCMAQKPDLVVFNDVSLLESYWPFLPSAALGVVVIHDEAYKYRRGAIRNQAALDAVVTVARFIECDLRPSLRRFGGQLRAIYNGIEWLPGDRKRPAPGTPIRLLHVTGTDPQAKGTVDLPGILEELEDRGVAYALTVLGEVNERIRDRCAASCRLGRVAWPGWVHRTRLLKLAREHDVCLMLSRSESFGMSMVEAMGQGCVPVAYRIVSGPAEVVTDGNDGFLVPFSDCAGVAEAVSLLWRDPATAARLGAAASQTARDRFTIAQTAAGYRGLVADIRQARRHRTPRRRPFGGRVSMDWNRALRRAVPSALARTARRLLLGTAAASYRLRKYR